MDKIENHCTEGCYKSNCMRLASGDCKIPHFSLAKMRANMSEPAVMVYERASLLMDDTDPNENLATNRRNPYIGECTSRIQCNTSQYMPSNMFSSSQHNLNLKRSLSQIQAFNRMHSTSSTSLMSTDKLFQRNTSYLALPSPYTNKDLSPNKFMFDVNPNPNPRLIVFILMTVILLWNMVATSIAGHLSYVKNRLINFFNNVGVINNNFKCVVQKKKRPTKQMVLWSPIIIVLGIVYFIIEAIIYMHDVLSKPVPLSVTEMFNFYTLFK